MLAILIKNLLEAATFLSCWHNVQEFVYLMDSLVFTIHPDKSVILSTQTTSFVGFVLNSISMT